MTPSKRRAWKSPELWIPGAYLLVSGVWILGSDSLVATIAGSVERQRALSMYKGLGFVLVTATLLFLGVRAALRRERAGVRRLRESEALLRAITDGVPDPVFIKDRASRWIFANPAVLRVLGRTLPDVLGRTDVELYQDGAMAAVLMATDRRIMERGEPEVIEERVVGVPGERFFLSTKVPFRDWEGRIVGVIGVARDITDQKRTERELHAARERVRQAEKLESVGRLAGGVAHDFNNLLTVILGTAELLREAVAGGTPPSLEDVEQIQTAGARARELTQQLLAVGRRQVTSPASLDLNDALRAGERMLRHLLGEDVRVTVELAPEPCPVLCDPAQLEQVLLNLALNARDAMPEGGRLGLHTRVLDVAAIQEVPAGAHAEAGGGVPGPGRWVELRVEDDGPGMEPEVLAHLFEPFFTTKPRGRGTGLGLATIYGIVKQADGQVAVRSAPGEGTTFRIYLPHRPLQARPAGRPPDGVEPALGGAETVLAVEDDPLVRTMTARALRSAGYDVLEAAGGPEALALAAGHAGPLHLVVTDVVMPGMDGRALADELRSRRPDLRVLFVSGYPDEVLARRNVLDRSTQLLGKPFTPGVLLARVRSLLDA